MDTLSWFLFLKHLEIMLLKTKGVPQHQIIQWIPKLAEHQNQPYRFRALEPYRFVTGLWDPPIFKALLAEILWWSSS